jgi:large subunit ribosomal protein L10
MEREPRADKVAVVTEVRERFEAADAVVVTEYRGLNVTDLADLRGALREAGGEYKVYKNTLVRRAIAESGPEGLVELLVGPIALAFIESDPSAVAKALRDFAKTNDNLVIKGGVLTGELLDEGQINALADLPSRDELMANIAAGLAAPLQQMASMMGNLMSEVSGLIQALSEKGGADDPTGEDSAPEPVADIPAEAEESTEESAADAESSDGIDE